MWWPSSQWKCQNNDLYRYMFLILSSSVFIFETFNLHVYYNCIVTAGSVYVKPCTIYWLWIFFLLQSSYHNDCSNQIYKKKKEKKKGIFILGYQHFITSSLGLLCSCSNGSWIYNYQCYQCLSPLKLWVRILLIARCTQYNLMW